ncbi:MAG: hypothetical protein K6G85_04450 [Eubacterium sp.]|nr:hypothetical protein [Eubacterium sp.]
MRAIPDELKRLYVDENLPKHIYVNFPNDSIDTITDDNIEEESFRLTQSLCEDSVPTWGGCLSSQAELTLIDTKENLKDKKIQIYMSLKDPKYRGNWEVDSEYDIDDIVQYNDKFYECLEETGAVITDTTKDFSDFEWSNNKIDKQTEAEGRDRLWNRITVNSDLYGRAGVSLVLRAHYYNASRVLVYYLSQNYQTVTFAKEKEWDGVTYPFCGWTLTLVNESGESVDLTGTVVTANRNLYSNELTPAEGSEYWFEKRGYIDTSNTQDLLMFTGYIDSADIQNDHRYMKVIAYDRFYKLGSRDITSWWNSAVRVNTNYLGEWISGTGYRQGNIVRLTNKVTGDKYYYHCKKDIPTNGNPPRNYSYYNPGDLISMADRPNAIITDGRDYWESFNSFVTQSIQTRRAQLAYELSFPLEDDENGQFIAQTNDFYITTPNKIQDKQIYALDALKNICAATGTFGYCNPETEEFRYIKPNSTNGSDNNYKGEWEAGDYATGDIVKVNNEESSYMDTYYKCLIPSTNIIVNGEVEEQTASFYYNSQDDSYFMAPSSNLKYIDFQFDESLLGEANIVVGVYMGTQTWQITEPSRIELKGFERNHIYISVSNPSQEFWQSFSAKKGQLIESGTDYVPNDEKVEGDIWEKCTAIYHPTGRVNLNGLYEQEQVNFGVKNYSRNGTKVIDESGNVLKGTKSDRSIAIVYNYLFNDIKGELSNVYNQINAGFSNANLSLVFTPFSLQCKGLPFLEVGDAICFDVVVLERNNNGELVEVVKHIESIVMSRTLSGTHSLTDTFEAKYE